MEMIIDFPGGALAEHAGGRIHQARMDISQLFEREQIGGGLYQTFFRIKEFIVKILFCRVKYRHALHRGWT